MASIGLRCSALASVLAASLAASGCATVGKPYSRTESVERTVVERDIAERDRVRVEASATRTGDAVAATLEWHDVCATTTILKVREVTIEGRKVKNAGLDVVGGLVFGVVGAGLLLTRDSFDDDPSSDKDYDEVAEGCPKDGDASDISESNCTTSREFATILGGTSAVVGLGLLIYAWVQAAKAGETRTPLGEREGRRDRIEAACNVRPVKDARLTLLDDNGRTLAEGVTGSNGRVAFRLNGTSTTPVYTLVGEAEGRSIQERLVLSNEEDALLAAAAERRKRSAVPPDLRGALSFDDSEGNGDGRLDAGERAQLIFKVTNAGRGATQDAIIELRVEGKLGAHLQLAKRVKVGEVQPNGFKLVRTEIVAAESLPAGTLRLLAVVKDPLGFDSVDFTAPIETVELRGPPLEVTQTVVHDDGSGMSHGNRDGKIQANELIGLTVVLQNTGAGDAREVRVELRSESQWVRVSTAEPIKVGRLAAGAQRRLQLGFVVARRFRGDALPLTLYVHEARPRFTTRHKPALRVNAAMMNANLKVDAAERSLRRLLVLELRHPGERLKASDLDYLSDLIRKAATDSLGVRAWYVLSRENILAGLPPGTDLNDCVDECEVKTAQTVGADIVVSGDVRDFGGELRATLKLHDAESGALVVTETAKGVSLKSLEGALEAAASAMFVSLKRRR